MASVILATSLLASIASASVPLPGDAEVVYAAQPAAGLAPLSPRGIEARTDHNKTFDIGWQVQDGPLFSANWTGGTGYIPLGPAPVEASVTESFSLSVECDDCRTFGNILADFNDDDGLSLSLTFNNVGVHMEFGVFAAQQGTYTIGLGRFFGKKPAAQNVMQFFNATVGLGIDLVLQFTGDVKATGGFQIAIPDRERVGLDIKLPDLDALLAGNFNVSAGLALVPDINFALLPVHISHTSANITAAIVLRAEAGIGLQKNPLTKNVHFGATVSASLTLGEVTFGEVSSDGADGSCKQALFIDVDSNAAAAAQVGGEIAGHEFEKGPDVSTIFLSAGTTTCLDATTVVETAVAPTSSISGSLACPTTAIITETKNTTKTFSLTSCLVSAINCPLSLSQVVLVTDVAQETATRCPSSNGTASVNGTATATTVALATFYTAGAITLPPLTSPIVASVAPQLLANVTAPVNATVTGVAVPVPVLTTPPPEVTGAVVVGGKNDTQTVMVSSSTAAGVIGRGSVGGSKRMGMVGVLVGAVVLI